MNQEDTDAGHQLIYQTSPVVTVATNEFINVPVILQFDDTPMISVVREQALGYTTEIPIYHSDGTYLAKVRGTRIYPTEDGKKAGLEMRHPKDMTVCELGGRTAFEIHHQAGAAFRLQAELHAPNGYFVKVADSAPALLNDKGEALRVGGMMMSRCRLTGMQIGIWLKSDGSCAIGVNQRAATA
ncbi:MAG: hypothetical protein WDO56_09510 [Gammaproteobacteria bacterium]